MSFYVSYSWLSTSGKILKTIYNQNLNICSDLFSDIFPIKCVMLFDSMFDHNKQCCWSFQ